MSKQHVKGLEDGFTKLYKFPGMAEKPPMVGTWSGDNLNSTREPLRPFLSKSSVRFDRVVIWSWEWSALRGRSQIPWRVVGRFFDIFYPPLPVALP